MKSHKVLFYLTIVGAMQSNFIQCPKTSRGGNEAHRSWGTLNLFIYSLWIFSKCLSVGRYGTSRIRKNQGCLSLPLIWYHLQRAPFHSCLRALLLLDSSLAAQPVGGGWPTFPSERKTQHQYLTLLIKCSWSGAPGWLSRLSFRLRLR